MHFTFFDIARPSTSRCNTPFSLFREPAQKILYLSFHLPLNLFHYQTCFYQHVALCSTVWASHISPDFLRADCATWATSNTTDLWFVFGEEQKWCLEIFASLTASIAFTEKSYVIRFNLQWKLLLLSYNRIRIKCISNFLTFISYVKSAQGLKITLTILPFKLFFPHLFSISLA